MPRCLYINPNHSDFKIQQLYIGDAAIVHHSIYQSRAVAIKILDVDNYERDKKVGLASVAFHIQL